MRESGSTETNTALIAVSSLSGSGRQAVSLNMDEYLTCTWEKFEAWIRSTIGSNSHWKIRSLDNASQLEKDYWLDSKRHEPQQRRLSEK